jgi:hypothetical protein
MKKLFRWVRSFFPKYVVPVSDKASGHSYSPEYIKAHPEEFKNGRPIPINYVPLKEICDYVDKELAGFKTYCIDTLAKINHSDYSNIEEQIANLEESIKFYKTSGFERSKEVMKLQNEIYSLQSLKAEKTQLPDLLYLIDFASSKGLKFVPLYKVKNFLSEYDLDIASTAYFMNINLDQIKEVNSKLLNLESFYTRGEFESYRQESCFYTKGSKAFNEYKDKNVALGLCATYHANKPFYNNSYRKPKEKVKHLNHSFILQPVSYKSAMGFVILLTIEHESIQ